MKNETVPVCELTGDIIADIEEHRSVEGVVTSLVDDKNAVVDILPCENWVEVVEKGVQLR